MCKNPLDFCKKLVKKVRKNYKNREIALTTIVFIIMGCFFYFQGGNLLSSELKSGNRDALVLEVNKDWKLKDNKDFKIEIKQDINDEIATKSNLEKEIEDITKNHPMEEMAPFIAQYDKKIAALIVGIAKKESNWGLHSPSKNGKTCYNYWGYKGHGSNGVALGYGCFATPEEAVDAIGGRIEELVNKKIDTPQKMVVWKCGSSCAAHDPAGVKKWISDVNMYYSKIAMLAS